MVIDIVIDGDAEQIIPIVQSIVAQITNQQPKVNVMHLGGSVSSMAHQPDIVSRSNKWQ